MSTKLKHIGLDIGSTTIKVIITDSDDNCLFSKYQRHLSDMRNTLVEILAEVNEQFMDSEVTITVTGSGGISASEWLGIDFVQEVIASTEAIKKYIPQTNVAIELGGEDAKLTFFDGSIDQRMNETCAGGTGAFIDQMAAVLQTDATGINDLSKKFKTIYPIAARCGVFAKTDVLPLINEGAQKEDIAMSIFQAVVDQTIGGLACGRSICGNIAFLGGPLFFLSGLRERFIDTLKLTPEQVIFPAEPQLFVAKGAALLSKDKKPILFKSIYEKARDLKGSNFESDIGSLPALFKNTADYEAFKERHSQEGRLEQQALDTAEGELFLGLDVGSTTTKAILVDKNDTMFFSSYKSNLGDPVRSVMLVLKEIYEQLPKNAKIAYSAITGYGEGLIKAALGVDEGEVETIAHFTAARYFVPDVSFILDIGGQDMKCMYIKNGAIDKIILNEACSSGCGSFLETFAKSVTFTVEEFAKAALTAKNPMDLGSRCTVFMNSKVKQAQKEGATVGDISAGLSYSIVKNALHKVIKMGSIEELGTHLVVQGGTFFNDAVLRAFELSVGAKVTRFAISGHMGAFGAALIARNTYTEQESTLIKKDALETFEMQSHNVRCKKCTNNCLLTINQFNGQKKYITGNRCEQGVQEFTEKSTLPNLFQYKEERLFSYYTPLSDELTTRGVIGIPRVLNIFENYPFWFTFFTELGFKVQLSDRSSKKLFNSGLETISSQTVCYPAKMVHGHIINLISKDIKTIFYPCVQFEQLEDGADNNFNCPVVCAYPEVIRLNVDILAAKNITFLEPFLGLHSTNSVEVVMARTLADVGHTISKREIREATQKAYAEMEKYKADVRNAGEEALAYINENKLTGVVLAGRPYHIDGEINHGIPELIIQNGLAVLSEDSIAHLGVVHLEKPMNAIDQWTYHSRLYKAAFYVAKQDNLELVQLNSFGCGLDAVTTEQTSEILDRHTKLYTLIKIDEGSNLGAVRIRIRSLIAAIEDRKKRQLIRQYKPLKERVKFSKEMKKTHTIIAPQISPIHSRMMEQAFRSDGYNFIILKKADREDINYGLKYVNNDSCYPAILAIGQLLRYLDSPECDPDRTAVIISQTTGACRATNYIAWLRMALEKMGKNDIPVLSFNLHGIEKHEGFNIGIPLVRKLINALLYADILMRLSLQTRPYEKVAGTTNALYEEWAEKCEQYTFDSKIKSFKNVIKEVVAAFDKIERTDVVKPRVGIVGEILVKFQPDANNHIIDIIEREGGEAVMPDFMDFILYCAYDELILASMGLSTFVKKSATKILLTWIEYKRGALRKALKKSKHFIAMPHIFDIANMAKEVVSLSNQSGEGWLLTGEMLELIESDVKNIICVQPFACLPNHITGKGVMKTLKNKYDDVNIVAIDYDPGASEVNQLNRIKLMISVAYSNMKKQNKES